MNFFKRLKLKLERAAERKRIAREGAQVAENTFAPTSIVTTPAPFKMAPEAPPVDAWVPTPTTPSSPLLTENPVDPSVPPESIGENARSYLERYPDVARHEYFRLRPARHYQFFGVKEGRLWHPADLQLAGLPPKVTTEWPKVVNVKGASIMLNAPVSPDWEPPMSALTFGRYGSFVSDPSNAPPGMPSRSPLGFPLIYPGLHWDMAKQEWAGTPIGPVRYHCGESSFDTEAQAIVEGRRIAASKGTPADPGWQQVYERMAQGRTEQQPQPEQQEIKL